MPEEHMTTLEDEGLPELPEKKGKTDEGDEDLQIEVVDDTPEDDRGREPMVTDPEPSAEELNQYSANVRSRISKLQRAYHDERRAKEQAAREREEAVRFAKQVQEQNKTLMTRALSGNRLLHETWKSKAESDLSIAKQKYKTAYESGDSQALTDAQEELNRAVVRHEQAVAAAADEKIDPSLQQQNRGVERTTEAPQVDEAFKAWSSKNPWYGKDRVMSGTARGKHEDLVAQGVHPIRDASRYYTEIDAEMRARYPDYEWGDGTKKSGQPSSRPKATTVVAPVTRTSKSPTKVTLTQTQVAIAKRLGVPLEEYAKQQAALNQGNQ